MEGNFNLYISKNIINKMAEVSVVEYNLDGQSNQATPDLLFYTYIKRWEIKSSHTL